MIADPPAVERRIPRGFRRPRAFPSRQGRGGVDHQIVMNSLAVFMA